MVLSNNQGCRYHAHWQKHIKTAQWRRNEVHFLMPVVVVVIIRFGWIEQFSLT